MIIMYLVKYLLVCASQIRRLVHGSSKLIRLLPKVIQVDFALLQSEHKLLEGMAWIYECAVVSLGVGISATAASQASR